MHNDAALNNIETPDGKVNILQLTDLHLYLDTSTSVAGINNHQSFMTCLKQALNENRRCDLILVTGDLVNEVKPEIYDRLYAILSKTGIPFACIAGNHDVTDELGTDLPYDQRQFVAHKPDARLLSRYCIKVNNWNILLLDSSVPGKVYGRVGDKNLQWLHQTLADCHYPVIIAMHHHVLPMNSDWIDAHITQDAQLFWQTIGKYPMVKAVVTGHVHQYYEGKHCNIDVYSTPSTCYQFTPKQDDFEIDQHAAPGYRWLSLSANGEIKSWISRLTDNSIS